MDNKSEFSREEILKMSGQFGMVLENLLTKVKVLIEKNKTLNDESHNLKESVNELNNKITDLKLQLNKINSDTLFKDKEISDLKNLLLKAENNNTNIRDKEFVKSRLKELISRIDVHLEQFEDNEQEYES
jgi:hypothetical protein